MMKTKNQLASSIRKNKIEEDRKKRIINSERKGWIIWNRFKWKFLGESIKTYKLNTNRTPTAQLKPLKLNYPIMKYESLKCIPTYKFDLSISINTKSTYLSKSKTIHWNYPNSTYPNSLYPINHSKYTIPTIGISTSKPKGKDISFTKLVATYSIKKKGPTIDPKDRGIWSFVS